PTSLHLPSSPLFPYTTLFRSSQTATGFFGGVMYPLTPGSGFGSPYVLQGATAVATNAVNNRVLGVFAGSDPFTPSQSGVNNMSIDRKSTRLNSSHRTISYAVF